MGHIEPTPHWCTCGNYFNKAMWEAVVKHPVQVELLESPCTTGSDICRRLIHLKPPASVVGVPGRKKSEAVEKTATKRRKGGKASRVK